MRRSWLADVSALPALVALAVVRAYQIAVSPLLPASCRFSPSCSHYACECLRDHGLLRGGWWTLRRLGRCHPFHPGGYDPPPPARARTAARTELGAARRSLTWRT